jgi:hypothetical protein
MSSDDTDDDKERAEVFFRVRQMRWRRNIDSELDRIDADRLRPGNGWSSRGAKPTPRRRDPPNEGQASRRDAPSGLAIDLYCPRWFGKQRPEWVDSQLKPNDQDMFRWPDILDG